MFWDRDKTLDVLAKRFFRHGRTRGNTTEIQQSISAILHSRMLRLRTGSQTTDLNTAMLVLFYATKLAEYASSEFVDDFNTREILTLATACYVHDLGMAHLPQGQTLEGGWTDELIAQARNWHVTAPTEIIAANRPRFEELFDFDPLAEEILPLICLAHGTDFHATLANNLIRSTQPCVAIYLRKSSFLSDELDLTEHRSLINRHPQWQNFPLSAQAHQFNASLHSRYRVPSPRCHVAFLISRLLKCL